MWLPDLADADRVQALLSRHADRLGLASEVTAVQLVDVRLTHPHRPGSPSCRGWATYRVRRGGAEEVLVYLKGFPDRATSEAAWRADRAARPAGHSEHLVAEDVVVWRFPEDPRLPALPELLAPRVGPAVPAPVAALLGPGAPALTATVVRYQPEASATLRVERDEDGGEVGDDRPAVFVKHLADPVEEVAARHQALWATSAGAPPLRVAEPLGSDPRRRVLWTRGVAGGPLATAVPADALPDTAGVVGGLLAALHASGLAATGTVSVDGTVAEMRKKAAKLAAAHPPVAGTVSGLVATAARRRDAVVREGRCTLHGDFHLDQLVASAEGPVLVDLDSMVTGPAEVDLAEFLVDLALRGLPPALAGRIARGLLSAYSAAAGAVADAAALGLFADAEFLNRCYRHLRRHTPGWEHDLEQELGRYAAVAELVGR